MLLSFNGCTVVSEEESRSSNLLNESNIHLTNARLLPVNEREAQETASTYLSKYKFWAVIQSCDEHGFLANNNMPSRYHFCSKLAKRFTLEDKKYRIIPLEDIAGPALGLKNYFMDEEEFDGTAFVVDHPSLWEEHFMSQ